MSNMPTSQALQIKWYNRVSIRIMLTWTIVALLSMLALVGFVNTDTKPALLQQSDRYIEQVGNTAVYRLLAQTAAIEAVAKSQAAIALEAEHSLPALIQRLSANLAQQDNDNILGGGYWTMPPYQIDGTVNSVSWRRNPLGMLEYHKRYQNERDYLQQEWFNVAAKTENNRCIWSRLYTDSDTHTSKVTCAVAVRNRQDDLLGVVSVDMDLSELNAFAQQTVQDTGGYVFLTDKNNRFISFASSIAFTDGKSQGGVSANTKAEEYAQDYPAFLPISNGLGEIDHQLISTARKFAGDRFASLVNALQVDVMGMTKSEAEIQAVSLGQAFVAQTDDRDTTLFSAVPVAQDVFLNDSATAYLFVIPYSHWKMAIVLPHATATNIADSLMEKLLWFTLGLIFLITVGSYYYLERWLLRPMRRTAKAVREVGGLIQSGEYKSLKQVQLSNRYQDEVGLVRESVNFLTQRIYANEEALGAANQLLEVKVSLRTQELHSAMQRLQESQMMLVQSEKMSMMGQMVAGVAHEVNTPLAYIKNNLLMAEDLFIWYERLQNDTAELIVAYQADDESAFLAALSELMKTSQAIADKDIKGSISSLLSDALFGAEQIADLVVDLRVFSSAHETKTEKVNIHELLEKTLKMARTNNDNYHVVRNFYEDLPNLTVSSSQLIQVFLNLFNNASHAMQGQGNPTLTLATKKVFNKIQIEITDNGAGMDVLTQEKIFEPFYTTKPAGNGTGLGLAICQEIIVRHQGEMTVHSVLGEGTTFVIKLPAPKTIAPELVGMGLPDIELPALEFNNKD